MINKSTPKLNERLLPPQHNANKSNVKAKAYKKG